MKNNVLTEKKYVKLIRDIRGIIEAGKARAAQAVRQELVVTYWEVGKRITEEHLSDQTGYRQAILKDLAEDLGLEYTTLFRAIQFFCTYKIAPRGNSLTWSHYKKLLTISDGEERTWYEIFARERGLGRDQLANAIKEDLYGQQKTGSAKSKAKTKLKRPTQATYVYKAIVDRVIDGDTLLLRMDLGFQVWKEQRVRLAEIDCPAMDEPGGEAAYRYVRDQLAKVDFVMIKTNKIDIYGRYVGHVFYSLQTTDKSKIFAQGNFLNQELLDKGLAERL